MKQGDRDRTEVRSVARALDVLEMMRRRAPAGIRVREAAEHLGVDSATASRLLSTMIARGYASRLPNRHYMLGTRSLRLATTWIDRLIEVAVAGAAALLARGLLGGGTETTFFRPGWFWRNEYRLASYGSQTFNQVPTGASNITFKPYVQTITTAVVWKFNSF